MIEKFAGEQWSVFEMCHSVASVDELIEVGKEGSLQINASNLILLLQGKVYEGYACNSVTGTISKAALTELQNAVRTRVLELTLELEKSIPAAAEITLGPPASAPAPKDTETVTQITQQIIHGNVTTISNTGDSANIQVNIFKGDETSLIKALIAAGIRKSDAAEFAEIISSEAPESSEEPFGKKAKAWIAKNIGKAMDGTWKIGIAIATQVLTEAALKYYGLK